MVKIRRDDLVKVMTGKNRGKQGKVLRVYPETGRALVEGINMVKKHLRRTQDNPQGGFTSQESPLSLSNVRRVCPRCNRPTRIGFTVGQDGTKQRVCKRCGEVL